MPVVENEIYKRKISKSLTDIIVVWFLYFHCLFVGCWVFFIIIFCSLRLWNQNQELIKTYSSTKLKADVSFSLNVIVWILSKFKLLIMREITLVKLTCCYLKTNVLYWRLWITCDLYHKSTSSITAELFSLVSTPVSGSPRRRVQTHQPRLRPL